MSRAPLADAAAAEHLDALIQRWAESAPTDLVLGVDHAPAPDDRGHFHWLIRLRGGDRPLVTLWISLRQRTVFAEAEVIGAPERAHEEIYRRCLERNHTLREMYLALGPENGVYLVARVPIAEFDEERLDEVVGATSTYVDELYAGFMALGFSWYRPRPTR